jgi:hypothetical protein
MDYEKYLEDRVNGMYSILESTNSVVMEAKKEVNREKGEKAQRSFIAFAKKHDPEKGEQLEKEPSKVKQAIKGDWEVYKKWRNEHAALNEILVLFLFGIAGVGIQEINRRQARKRGK